ncbi:MAG: bifunctional riboflavin kinase/FAD synthetase, partial [Candidatus Acidiferrales bacterium]
MRVLHGFDSLTEPFPAPVVTIGNFDGVHLGHRAILDRVVVEARARQGAALVLSFDPHPSRVLAPDRAPRLLTTPEQKLALLETAGIEAIVFAPFTLEFSRLSPQKFVEQVLHRRLGAAAVCIGANFRFGHRQAGDAALLAALAKQLGIAVHVVEPVVVQGEVASSSTIRRLVSEGDVRAAARLLGRPFALTGGVQRGEGRGRQLGFPTLNFVPEQECLPPNGVYVTETVASGRAHPSATNVGIRPTFDGQRLLVESHLLDFSDSLQPARLEVHFHDRLRDEMRFPSADALKAQIADDVARARRF